MVHLNRNGRRGTEREERAGANGSQIHQAVVESESQPVAVELQTSLAKLLKTDGGQDVRQELARIVESRQATAAVMRALLSFDQRLARSETMLRDVHELLHNQRPVKDWYTVAELAETLGKAEFTVREWCRLGRVYASKRECGRGNSKEWIVSHEELLRIQNEGLLAE
jgi:hypothetical protein